MKVVFLNLIALIIAISSLHVNVESKISFKGEGEDALFSLPLIDLDPMRSPNSKNSSESENFSPLFLELSIFVDLSELPIVSFLYYLPLYSLNRLSDFFLLI